LWRCLVGLLNRECLIFLYYRGAFLKLSAFDPDWTNALIQELSSEAEKFARAGTPEGELNREVKAYMRYEGQGWKIDILYPKLFASSTPPQITFLSPFPCLSSELCPLIE